MDKILNYWNKPEHAGYLFILPADPEYCMDSIAPGEFRYWSEILTGPVIDFVNNLTFYKDKDPEELLDKCQEASEKIINEKYGYQ